MKKRPVQILVALGFSLMSSGCGMGTYYTMDLVKNGGGYGSNETKIIDDNLIQATTNVRWYPSIQSKGSIGTIYFDIQNRTQDPIILDSITVEHYPNQELAGLIKVDHIEVIGLTQKNEATGFDLTPQFTIFSEIPEKYRTVPPSEHTELTSRRYLLEIRSEPLEQVKSVTLELSIKGSSPNKQIEYHKSLILYKNNHRYFWFLRDG